MKKYSRRTMLSVLAASCYLPMLSARAEDYPARPIRIITTSTAGSSVDVLARRIAKYFGESLGQSSYVDNVAGAGGIIGTEQLIRSKPDGYTLAVVAKSHVITPLINKAARYNVLTQTTAICMLQESCSVLVASRHFPADTIAQLVAYAKRNPGKVNFGFGGLGTTNDLQGRLIQQLAQIDVLNVPYKGAAGLLSDLLAGTVDVAVMAIPAVSEHIRSGALKPLGITRGIRTPALPDVPPVKDELPDFNFGGWYALVGPAGIPADITTRLSKEIKNLQARPEFIQAAAKDGETPFIMDTAQTASFMRNESYQVAKIIKATNIVIE